MNFQLRLAETTNSVSIVYGPYFNVNTTSRTNQIGLRGATNTDYNNRTGAAGNPWTNTTAGTANNATVARDNVNYPAAGLTFMWTPPTCVAPGNTTAVNILTTSADLTWTASSTPPSNGYTVYYSTVNTAPDGTTVLDATNSVTTTNLTAALTGLTHSTTYYVWIRTNCSATDQSSWLALPSFVTACGPLATMFEDFDSYPTGSIVPNCWARIVPAASAGSQSISSTGPASGTRNIYQYASATATPVIVVLPEFSNINAGTHWLRFKARVSSTGGALEVGYVTDPADAATFTVISTLLMDNTTYTAPDAEKTVIIPSTVPANARIAIRNSSDAKSYYWDDVYWEAVPTCYVPEFITVSSVTSNTVGISWTSPTSAPANGYDVYYNTTGVAPDATTVLDATNSVSVGAGVTSATISSLTPATTYYIWVRSKCGAADMSAWAPAPVLVTACVAFTVPYAENFDTTSTGSSSNNNVPTCWTYYEAPGSTGYGYVYGTATNVLSPPNSYYLYRASTTTGEMMLISPPTTALTDGTNRVRFSAKSTNSGTLQVGTMDNAANPASFVVLQTFTLTNTFEEYTVNFPVGTATYFAFNNASAAAGNVYLDDIFVEDIPTCVEPTNVTVNNITQNGATVNWTATVTLPATYDIYISASNTPPTAATTPTISQVSGTTATVGTPPLASSTTYFVWVRSYCSASDQSIWTDAVSFMTLCAPPAITGTSVNPTPVCVGGTATLTATADAGATINWYADATTATPLATGGSYTTPVLTATTNYYVSASTGSSGNVGPASPSALGTISASNFAITTYYQIFDVISPTTLVSIDVYPVSSVAIGTAAAIEIRDSSGTTLISVPYTVTVNDGVTPQTVVLNYPLAVGTGYRIGQGVAINLNRNTSGAVYPYTSSKINITGNNFTSGPDYWYYIYNWNFSTVCESGRTMVTATYDSTCQLGTSETQNEKEISIYPNPFKDVVNISDVKDLKSVTVVDMSGRMVKSITNPGRQINLGELTAGLYILKLDYKDGTVKTVKAIKK
jgi:hypothetical protein